jgi:hypothetical protein
LDPNYFNVYVSGYGKDWEARAVCVPAAHLTEGFFYYLNLNRSEKHPIHLKVIQKTSELCEDLKQIKIIE